MLLNFHFLLFDAIDLTLLDLVNDNEGTFAASVHPYFLTFFVDFKALQTFNFHHKIEFLLFINPLTLKLFVFLKLFITDSDNLGVEHHLVHVLDVVELFIHLSLGFRKDTNILISLDLLNIVRLNFSSALSIKGHHAFLACLGFLLSSFSLLTSKSSS